MTKLCQLVFLALTLAAIGSAARAEDLSANTGKGFTADAKAAGHDVAQSAEKVGHAAKDAAVDVGHGAKDVGHGVANATRKGWDATKDTAKRVFHKGDESK